MPRKTNLRAEVIDLAKARAERRLCLYRTKISAALDSNRRAIGGLYATGALFSHDGARAGRDLLLAHQHLLKVVTLINRLSDRPSTGPSQATGLYRELDELLERTLELTSRTGNYLTRLRHE